MKGNFLLGTSWMAHHKPSCDIWLKTYAEKKTWQIFIYFKCQFHNERLHSQIFRFLDIFWRSLHFFPQKISSLWDQPFCFLAKNTLFIDIFQVAKYLLENICSLSTFEKVLRCFRPKMSAHCFFTLKHFYLLGTLSEKKHHIIWEFFPTWGGGSSQIPKLL